MSKNRSYNLYVSDEDYWQLMQHYDPSSAITPPGAKDAINLARYEWPKTGKFVFIPYTLHSTISKMNICLKQISYICFQLVKKKVKLKKRFLVTIKELVFDS